MTHQVNEARGRPNRGAKFSAENMDASANFAKDANPNNPLQRIEHMIDSVSLTLGMSARRLTPMVWDVMVAAAFVVLSVAVLACFLVKFLLTSLQKPHPVASQHRPLSITPLRQGLYKTQDCGPQAEGKANGYTLRDLSGGRYDTGR